MTNKEMLCTALKQSALELNCTVDDLTGGKSKAVISSTAEGARKYLSLPFYCQLVSYGSGIVASVNEEIYADAKAYIEKYAPEHCFETPNMLVLQSALERRGMSACFMAEYWLCDTDAIRPLDCGYELRLLTAEDFAPLYTPQWSNALCEKRKELDVLGIGAYDGEKLGRLCRVQRGLRKHVADRCRCSAGIQAARDSFSCDKPPCGRDNGAGQDAVLLLRMEQRGVRPQCHTRGLPPGMGGADRQKRRIYRGYE